MNIAIVGNNYNFIKRFSEEISNMLELKLVDFKRIFEKGLIENSLPFIIENEILQYKEKSILQEIINEKNNLIYLPLDVLISNKNYELFNNYLIIKINSKKYDKIEINIKKIIKNNKIIEICEEKIDFTEIIKNIRGYYDR